ncbi:hypothetical protein ANTRET_LOCUS11025 [Anthophora retusa]
MLDSLVRVSRRVLRVPKAIASPTGNSNFGQSKDTACQQLNRPGDGTRSVPPALDGVYHPLRAAFSSNPTLRRDPPENAYRSLRAWHPLWVNGPIQDGLGRGSTSRDNWILLNTTFPSGSTAGFSAGLIPVRSPLLRKSLLVSFPPLKHKSRHARGKRRRTPNKIARTQRSPAASSNLTARLTRARLGTFFKNVGGDIRETNEEMERQGDTRRKQYMGYVNDPQPSVVQELYPWTAMCVRNVDVHVSCSSHVDAQLAAFFIDPRAK